MGQYNTLKLNLSKSQLNKLKSGIQNRTEITVNLSHDTNFSNYWLIHKFRDFVRLLQMAHKRVISKWSSDYSRSGFLTPPYYLNDFKITL